jgi:hypothetical protein
MAATGQARRGMHNRPYRSEDMRWDMACIVPLSTSYMIRDGHNAFTPKFDEPWKLCDP